MNRKYTRFISIAMVILLVGSILAGCGKSSDDPAQAEKSTAGQATATQAASTAAEKTAEVKEEFSYPIKTDVTLKYWMYLNGNVTKIATSIAETPFAQELMKQTGVKIEFIHPPIGQESETFNIMISSGDYPDIIEYNWSGFPGGPEKAMSDGVIMQLNDVINQHAPNLKKFLDSNAEANKMVKTDTGKYYVFPSIRGDDYNKVYYGPVIRKDWLDDCGLAVPTTVDEWEVMLKTFKEKKNAEAPLSCYWNESFMTGAFGTIGTFYVDDGKVKYGPIEPGYKDYITLFRKWYQEGLLDKNFATLDAKTLDANILGGKTGATVGYAGSSIGRWMLAMKEKDAKYNLIGALYPVVKKGDKPKFGQLDKTYMGGNSAAISATCKNVELAARLLDFAYGDEGHNLYNFGTEGTTYNMVNGKPVYTELITNNPEKLSMAVALSKYTRASYAGPYVQDKEYAVQSFSMPQQKDAISNWMNTDMALHMLPPITPTPDESSEQANIISTVSTYLSENFFKFVMGEQSMDKYDAFVAEIKKMGIERAIELKQKQVDRYASR